MSSEAGAPVRSYLYAPGNSEKLVQRVFETGADAVILDLEDSVPKGEKDAARAMVAALMAGVGQQAPLVHVRVNAVESGRAKGDIEAVTRSGLDGIRLPKAERVEDVREVSAWIAQAEEKGQLDAGSVRLDLTIETALGVARARELAVCDPRVGALVFGEADFLADVGAEADDGRLETLHARSELVIAARAGGRLPPVDGAYTRLRDPGGLEERTRAARRLGFFGMSAIHPEQLAVIHAVFTPSDEDARVARELLDAYEQAMRFGSGAVQLPDGRFVDRPIAERARRTVLLWERERERRT